MIKRYRVIDSKPDDEGQWIRLEDHLKQVNEADRIIDCQALEGARLRAALTDMVESYQYEASPDVPALVAARAILGLSHPYEDPK